MVLHRLATDNPDGVRAGLAVADAIRTLPPMLKINLEIDVAGFEREVDTHMLKAFRPVVVDALNTAGEAAVDAI